MARLQEERSAETRRRLLDATVACLSERGYTGTTTTEVAERAGVSRGAQLHHFPRKEELVLSAVEYLLDRRRAEFGAMMEQLRGQPTADRMARVIDLMWPAFKGPTFYAWLELVVAGRTDPNLRQAVRAISQRFFESVEHFFFELFGPTASPDELRRLFISFVFGQLESLAVERTLFDLDAPDPEDFTLALDTLKRLAKLWLNNRDLLRPGDTGTNSDG